MENKGLEKIAHRQRRWPYFFAQSSTTSESSEDESKPTRWSMGVLNDTRTHEVPGSVLLLTGHRNEPLGLRNAPARVSSSSLPSPFPAHPSQRMSQSLERKKKTKDGAIILEPQPDDSRNDPLNWPSWRRDTALLSLGLYCMVGGGMTPILAAGFTNVASTYDVTVPQVALTTGLYMMGLGVGSVFASPTAILYGKRPVYLVGAILFIATSICCAASPSYISLLIARIIQGLSVSPVECLPSATIAEIFFLHERAYRIGIYTLLLLGGKNLVPLVSAAVIESFGWRWVFWIVAIIVGFCWILLFLFVPETFWDRTPRPKSRRVTEKIRRPSMSSRKSSATQPHTLGRAGDGIVDEPDLRRVATTRSTTSGNLRCSQPSKRPYRPLHVGFVPEDLEPMADREAKLDEQLTPADSAPGLLSLPVSAVLSDEENGSKATPKRLKMPLEMPHELEDRIQSTGGVPPTPGLHSFNSPFYVDIEKTDSDSDYLNRGRIDDRENSPASDENPSNRVIEAVEDAEPSSPQRYTHCLKTAPRRTFAQQLKPWNGRLHDDNWFRVAIRPFILFAYPAVLWSAVVYACSIGWLIVLSESVATIYRSQSTYNFSALSTGLIYLSPFIGGILGTAVAGKVSDIIVRAMAKRNGGLYEPEFRLVMAIPISISTAIGLMGFGWSAQVHDGWIVPTIFFGTISFGCSLGSTTSITFCVDSYRQYAGEALVTLNFSKNIFHGLLFSLFFNNWLDADGPKTVFVAIGGIQLGLMLFTIPMYIFGKRARMWTVRKNFMEKF